MASSSQTSQLRSEAGRKAAATRKRNAAKRAATTVKGDARRASTDAQSSADRVTADLRRAVTDSRTAADAVGTAAQAEANVRAGQVRRIARRSVDLPVGASLVARDGIVSTVRGLASTLSHRAQMERELARCERRGAGARDRLQRGVQRTRRDVERGVGERRAHVEKIVADTQRRIGSAL